MTNEIDERRKFKRYKIREGAFAALMPGSHKLGQILDLGKGGLSFLYIQTGAAVDESCRVDIYVAGGKYYLSGLPVRIISDITIPNKIPVNPVVMRRQGVQFGELTQEQAGSLEAFIQKYAGNEL